MKKSKLLLNYKFDKYYSLNLALADHWSKTNKQKKQIEEDVHYLILNQIRLLEIKESDKNNYYYNFYFEYNFKNENCDTDNFAFMRKAIIDSIKNTDLIHDDCFKYCSIYDYKYNKSEQNSIQVYYTRTKKEVFKAKKENKCIKKNEIKNSKWNYPNKKRT